MIEWEGTHTGYKESKQLLKLLGMDQYTNPPKVWWEIALLSAARLPEVHPTVFLAAFKEREFVFEQTDQYMPIPVAATREKEVTDICGTCNRTSHLDGLCAHQTNRPEVLPNWNGFSFEPHFGAPWAYHK